MNALVQLICDHMGYTGEWDHLPSRTSDVRNLCSDNTKARELLGFEPQTSFADGIRETLDWYAANSLI